jgi:hypothetical protein
MGALTTVVVPWLVDRMDTTSWQAMAWWIHDNLPYSELQFFPRLFAFNIGWHEAPKRTIYSFIEPRGFLTKPGFYCSRLYVCFGSGARAKRGS